MSHTPGPWRLFVPTQAGGALGEKEDRGILADNGGDPVVIGETWLYGPGSNGKKHTLPATANARLIAAAPDLLEACEAALRAFETLNTIAARPFYERPINAKLRAAIEKARG